jgi:DNA polymerase-4
MRQQFGLTCSVGIGPNKMLAKLASGMKKPDGLVEIRPEQVKDLLENLPVGKLHGVGEKTRQHLAKLGITTAGELGRYPKERLIRDFGIMGEVLQGMGRGIDHSPIIPYHKESDYKSMGHSYTMSRNTKDLDVVRRHLLRLSEMVGRRLREEGYAGRTVTLTVRYEDMKFFGSQKSLPEHLDDGYEIYRVAWSILKSIPHRRQIRLVGVSVSNLV